MVLRQPARLINPKAGAAILSFAPQATRLYLPFLSPLASVYCEACAGEGCRRGPEGRTLVGHSPGGIGEQMGGAMGDTGGTAIEQSADPDDERESCGLDFTEEVVPDDEILFVVLSPEGDPARIEEYHRLAVGEGG